MKRIIEQFNREDAYLIISDYPEPVTGEGKNHGIAWHTRETTIPFIKTYGHRFIVLAEKGKHKKPEVHEDNHLLVLRVFDQRHHSLFPTILKWLLVFDKIKKVYIHSEFCTSGGIGNFILLIPFLLLIKAMGRKIIYFEHNVVTRFDPIATHFGLKPHSFKLAFYNIGIKWYYRMLGILTDTIIVMDKILKTRMTKYADEKKIICKPFWIEKKSYYLTKNEARKEIGIKDNEFLLIYFGFISWYKGADWLIDQIQTLKNKIGKRKLRLILVGGQAYSLKDKPYYREFYKDLKKKANGNVKITGFVPEQEVGKYFTASDLMLLPYRGYFGASGSLSYAFAYGKPFLLSNNMSDILLNKDLQDALKESGLTESDILFELNLQAFEKMLKKTMRAKTIKKLEKLSNLMADKRSITRIMSGFNTDIYKDAPVNLPLTAKPAPALEGAV